MSDTPRTDAEQDDARNVALEFTTRAGPPEGNCYVVPAEFARQLEREIDELKAWRAGKKGIEDYYMAVEKCEAWRECATRLAATLRSVLRGETASYSATGEACCYADLARFERLKRIGEPLTPALSPHPMGEEGETGPLP